MNYAKLIAKKEFKSYFNTPSAYVILVAFLLISGWFSFSTFFINNRAELSALFNIVPLIYIFFIPAITMGLIAKEKSSGTIELLSTFPINSSDIVYGKFMSSIGLIAVGLAFTLIHFLTIVLLGKNIDFGAIFCGYLGLLLLGGVYSAIGIFASGLSKNQIVSFIISIFIILFLFMIQFTLILLPSYLAGFFQYLSVGYHLSNISRGIIDTRNIVYFVSLIVLFLSLAVYKLQSERTN
jgi:ABC-2 type transport system permease protein